MQVSRLKVLPSFFPARRCMLSAGAAVLFAVTALRPAPAQIGQSAQPASDSGAAAQSTPAPADQEQTAPAKKKHSWIQRDDPEDSSSSAKAPKAKPVKAADQSKAKAKEHVAKDEKVVQSKDTRAELRKEKKYNPLIGKDSNLPDKQLYDKALDQENRGHFDVARLDLQTLLSTYPDSQYLMRAKLAYADCWFKEGGSAAMAQAEQEYGDFITFFPNVPEAAEAQMRMGDIYLKQMDVPDRDYSKAMKAEQQYRTMLKTYPDAPPVLLKEAAQKLRDVQEVLAEREFELGQFYGSHDNYAAAIARYQTVVDTYPLFSHMDDTLIGIGDAYAAQARNVRAQPTCAPDIKVACLPEGAKSKLVQEDDGKAAAAYRTVVRDHAAAPHAEDARERLAEMNLPIPTPTPEQVAASEALEGSRAQYTMRKRLELLFVRKPDTVTAAQIGAPPLEDATPTTAPSVVHQIEKDYLLALNPNAPVPATAPAKASTAAAAPATPNRPAVAASAPASTAAPTLNDVPTAGQGTADSSVSTMTETNSQPATGGTSVGTGGASLGVEVLTPGAMTGGAVTNRAVDSNAANGVPDANYGITGPASTTVQPLPAAERAAPAPDAINEAQGHSQPAAEVKDPDQKKNPKPAFDKYDESSSKHKKKKGVSKINPF